MPVTAFGANDKLFQVTAWFEWRRWRGLTGGGRGWGHSVGHEGRRVRFVAIGATARCRGFVNTHAPLFRVVY